MDKSLDKPFVRLSAIAEHLKTNLLGHRTMIIVIF